MIAKMAIYVCPVPGCAAISSRKSSICPTHSKLMIREVYAHQPKRPPSSLDNVGNMADILSKMFK